MKPKLCSDCCKLNVCVLVEEVRGAAEISSRFINVPAARISTRLLDGMAEVCPEYKREDS